MFISISVSGPLRKQLDSLKSRVKLPNRARAGIRFGNFGTEITAV